MTQPPLEPPFRFQGESGRQICRQILLAKLNFGPHDYQLDVITRVLDGEDVIAVSATGSGKSAYIYMVMLVALAILEDKSLCPFARFPVDPAMVVVCPTTALEEDLETKLKGYGLRAKAINAATKMDAERENINIWQLVETDVSIILISPEMLSTAGFQNLLQNKKFKARSFKLVVDEIHLLNSWGAGFRPTFQQIGLLRQRFPTSTSFIGMTATLQKGKPYQSVCKFLGLTPGKFYLQRRSNARPDIRLSIRTIHTNQASERFPDLDWVLQETGKTLIFCPTIRLGFKLAVYFWYQDPRNVLSNNRLRLFNSLNSQEYNDNTLTLLRANTSATIITIATDKLSVGVDIPDFQRVIIIDPVDLDDLWQKGGRVGRDRNRIQDAQVFVYIPAAKMTLARELAEEQSNGGPALATSKRGRPRKKPRQSQLNTDDADSSPIDIGLVSVITAECPVDAINIAYDNPTVDTACSILCTTCETTPPPTPRSLCDCNYCTDRREALLESSDTQITPITLAKPAVKKQPPMSSRVTQEMRQHGEAYLKEFRIQLWMAGDDHSDGLLPIEAFFPSWVMKRILDDLPTLLAKDVLTSFLTDGKITDHAACAVFLLSYTHENKHLTQSSSLLFEALIHVHQIYDDMRAQKKLDAATKRRRDHDAQAGNK